MNKKIHNPKANIPAVYIPCWLIQVPIQKISHGAKLLYGRLAQWSREDGTVYRSKNDLKEELGVSHRTLGDLIKELKDIGLIDTVQPIKGGISHYIFYDHEWMVEPIKKQLVYKSDSSDPMQDPALPHAEFCTTPVQDPAPINIKKIKRTNLYKKSTRHETFNFSPDEFSCEPAETSYTVSDEREEKFDFQDNQSNCSINDIQVTETERESTKSDYFENQTTIQTVSKKQEQYSIKNIFGENIFQVPEQMIFDWIENRKKKRAPVTKTAWGKINKELAKCKERGIDPIEAFETMVASGWQSFKAEYFYPSKKPAFQWDVDSVMRA